MHITIGINEEENIFAKNSNDVLNFINEYLNKEVRKENKINSNNLFEI